MVSNNIPATAGNRRHGHPWQRLPREDSRDARKSLSVPVPIDSSAVSAAKAGSDPLPESAQDTRGIVVAEVYGSRNRALAPAVQPIGERRRLPAPYLTGPLRPRRRRARSRDGE